MNSSPTNPISIEDMPQAWCLVLCKFLQEARGEESLLRQGYSCYRPQHNCERMERGRRQIIAESLFPSYLFIKPTVNLGAVACLL